jgi:hypothetical protein
VTGQLQAVDADGIRLVVDGEARTLPVDTVRAVVRADIQTTPTTLTVTCADGSTVAGTDIAWRGDTLTVSHPAGAIELPMARVQSVSWHDAAGEGRWEAGLPPDLESDVIIVRKGDDFEFVQCAITGITADSVTVKLDEETIPVNRGKVIGLRWLREPTPPGGVRVRVDGGNIAAKAVSWTPDGLVIDDGLKLPAAMLAEIDYASGRTLRVATLPPERIVVEPFFGALGNIEGLADYFRPRATPAPAGGQGIDLVVRPRTEAVWRIPAESREFRTSLSVKTPSDTGPVVVIAIDDREVFRGPVDAAAGNDGRVAVGPLPVAGGRRLHLSVDFGPSGAAAGVVVLHDPVLTR